MLIQSALPGSFEASLSLPYKNDTCDWTTIAENWKECCKCEKDSRYPCEKLVPLMDGESNQGNARLPSSLASCSQVSSVCTITSCSQLSSIGAMEEKSVPTLVYQRKKVQRKSASVSSAQSPARMSDGCLSYISSESPSMVAEEVQKGFEVYPGKVSLNINSESESDRFGIETDLCCVNESYSSSKSNGELGSTSLRIEVDETGECSSSSALVVEGSQDHLSERDTCISIIRNQWFAKGIWPFKVQSSNKLPGTTTHSICVRTCKVCEIQERSLEMLICDQCEEAFHVSCCNPRLKKKPIDDWFCFSCLKKKHRILNEITTKKKPNSCSEMGRSDNAMSIEELGSIASMLIGIGPYTPGVRIGQEFQADVPDWSGPSFEDIDAIDKPTTIDPSDCICLHGQNGSKLSRISSIGNWVQCRQVIDGIGEDIDGTICGKWRRAPLFEVQTDEWECFCCILWDPAHADCAAPQELDTEEILKQLKYIEMLRPRLTVKRCKLDQAKDAGPIDNSEGVKNIQTS